MLPSLLSRRCSAPTLLRTRDGQKRDRNVGRLYATSQALSLSGDEVPVACSLQQRDQPLAHAYGRSIAAHAYGCACTAVLQGSSIVRDDDEVDRSHAIAARHSRGSNTLRSLHKNLLRCSPVDEEADATLSCQHGCQPPTRRRAAGEATCPATAAKTICRAYK
jgi:hypothetical protein